MKLRSACPVLVLMAVPLCCLKAQVIDAVRVGVFGLFRPTELLLKPAAGSALVLEADGRAFDVAEHQAVQLKLHRPGIKVALGGQSLTVQQILARSRKPGGGFLLSVPRKIERTFRGRVEVSAAGNSLRAVIQMDVETAVASVVAAESASDAQVEFLKAQSVVTRSYLLAAGPRHRSYDFCDTTHCQFLRAPPDPGSRIARAVETTQRLVLHYRGRVIPALFSRSCGGSTRSLEDAGFSGGAYPYYRVDCRKCRRDPERWQRRISHEEAAALDKSSRSEAARIAVGRRLGWEAVPSNRFAMRTIGNEVLLTGTGRGHGIGLCQRGGAAMAAADSDFLSILRHYYPDTRVGVSGR